MYERHVRKVRMFRWEGEVCEERLLADEPLRHKLLAEVHLREAVDELRRGEGGGPVGPEEVEEGVVVHRLHARRPGARSDVLSRGFDALAATWGKEGRGALASG